MILQALSIIPVWITVITILSSILCICDGIKSDIHLKTIPNMRIKYTEPDFHICVSSITECSIHCNIHNCSFANFGLVNMDPSTCCQNTCSDTCKSTCLVFKMANEITCDDVEYNVGWTLLCKY